LRTTDTETTFSGTGLTEERMIGRAFGIALVAATAALPALAQPAGNAENGQRLFNQCRACHTINEGGRNGVGPNLHGLFNRQMASLQGFNYSPAFRAKAPEVGQWNDAALRQYLANPAAMVPGTRMAFQGFRDNEQNISDVIAYLHQASGS
jgi:cytochrome c